MTGAAIEARFRGRPRERGVDEAALSAAYGLLVEQGLSAVSIDAIAARAGVSRPTIYRRWPNRAAIIMDAFLAAVAPAVPFRGSGSAVADMRQQLAAVVRLFRGPTGRLAAALVADMQSDTELAAAFRDRFMLPRRELARRVLEQGIASGELTPGTDSELVMDMVWGAIYHRLLVGHLPLTEELSDALVDQLLVGCGIPESGGGRRVCRDPTTFDASRLQPAKELE